MSDLARGPELLEAAKKGDLETIKQIVNECPGLIQSQVQYSLNNYRLFFSSEHIDIDYKLRTLHYLLLFLLIYQPKISSVQNTCARDNEGHTALHHAALAKQDDSTAILLYLGAENIIDVKSFQSFSSLYYAAGKGANDVVMTLVDGGADLNAGDLGDWVSKISLKLDI